SPLPRAGRRRRLDCASGQLCHRGLGDVPGLEAGTAFHRLCQAVQPSLDRRAQRLRDDPGSAHRSVLTRCPVPAYRTHGVKNKRAAAARARRLSQVLRRAAFFLLPWGRRLATLAILVVAVAMALVTWDYYVTAPWTRDGRVRVQVASVAPEVSGQIIELRVADNQFVHEGDVLYVIDPFDFEVAVRTDKALLQQRAADQQVKQVQSERRQHLSSIA